MVRFASICALGVALVPIAAGPTAAAQSPDASARTAADDTPLPETAGEAAHMLAPYESMCAKRTGTDATMIFPASAAISVQGRPLMAGDQVAVFSEDGICAGFMTWTGDSASLTVWGDNEHTSDIDGLQVGDSMHIRIRTAASGIEHSARDSRVTLTFRDDAHYLTPTPTFAPDGIYIVERLAFDSVEHAGGVQ